MPGARGSDGAGAARRQVTVYCDGACRGNPGIGGYGTILLCDGHRKELSGAVPMTTNNKMELTAAIVGLETLTEPCQVAIYTDSQYLKNGITVWIHAWRARGWRTTDKKVVRNRELWGEAPRSVRNPRGRVALGAGALGRPPEREVRRAGQHGHRAPHRREGIVYLGTILNGRLAGAFRPLRRCAPSAITP